MPAPGGNRPGIQLQCVSEMMEVCARLCGTAEKGAKSQLHTKEYLGGLLKEGMSKSNLKYIRLYLKLDSLAFLHFSLVLFPPLNIKNL